MKEEQVILVTPEDTVIGTMPKMEAHEKAVLHRAFSVFVLNDKGVLGFLSKNKTASLLELSAEFQANEGYLNVALRVLASQGWLKYEILND